MGVRWAFQDLTVEATSAPLPHAELRYETEWVRVYELTGPEG